MNRQGQGQDPLLVHSLIRSRVLLRMAGVELWGSTRRHTSWHDLASGPSSAPLSSRSPSATWRPTWPWAF